MNVIPFLIVLLIGWMILALMWKSRAARAQAEKVRIMEVIKWANGGIHKRIDECREIATCIFINDPQVFERTPWVLGWLRGTDEFLQQLRDASRSEWEKDDGCRSCAKSFARLGMMFGRTASMYEEIRHSIDQRRSMKAESSGMDRLPFRSDPMNN